MKTCKTGSNSFFLRKRKPKKPRPRTALQTSIHVPLQPKWVKKIKSKTLKEYQKEHKKMLESLPKGAKKFN